MLRNLLLFLALFMLAGFTYAVAEPGSTYQPQESETKEPKDPDEKQVQTRSVVGTIVSVDMEEKKITIKDEVTDENQEFSFNDSTSFHQEQTQVTVDKMKTGDRVSLEVDSQGNRIVRMDNPSTVPPEE